jgi:hypothetical protein
MSARAISNRLLFFSICRQVLHEVCYSHDLALVAVEAAINAALAVAKRRRSTLLLEFAVIA